MVYAEYTIIHHNKLRDDMKKKLKDIANVSTGYIFRSKIESDLNGNVSLLKSETLLGGDYVSITPNNLQSVLVDNVKPENIIKSGDVLFKAKGLTNESLFIEEVPDNTIVSSLYFIIRVFDKNVIPEFLTWYLNQKIIGIYLKKYAGFTPGATISSVSKNILEDLTMVIPSVEDQEKIVKFQKLSIKEKRLMNEVYQKKIALREAVLKQRLNIKGAI